MLISFLLYIPVSRISSLRHSGNILGILEILIGYLRNIWRTKSAAGNVSIHYSSLLLKGYLHKFLVPFLYSHTIPLACAVAPPSVAEAPRLPHIPLISPVGGRPAHNKTAEVTRLELGLESIACSIQSRIIGG